MPVVVVPCGFVPRNNFPNVAVRNPEYFAKELRDAERAISDADIEAVAQHLEKLSRAWHCRTAESLRKERRHSSSIRTKSQGRRPR